MSKKILILVLSCDIPPYDEMVKTSMATWDSIDNPQCETIYYFSSEAKKNTDKFIYIPVKESLHTMGYKLIGALEWALENKEFDYIFRPHSCIYVDKKQLAGYINELPEKNVFAGPLVDTAIPKYLWGGLGLTMSRDVVQTFIDNKDQYDHTKMEDVGISNLATKTGIPFYEGAGCSIDQYGESWLCLSYGSNRSKSFTFTDFKDVPLKSNQFSYRCKQDGNRGKDKYIMEQLFQHLK